MNKYVLDIVGTGARAVASRAAMETFAWHMDVVHTEEAHEILAAVAHERMKALQEIGAKREKTTGIGGTDGVGHDSKDA